MSIKDIHYYCYSNLFSSFYLSLFNLPTTHLIYQRLIANVRDINFDDLIDNYFNS